MKPGRRKRKRLALERVINLRHLYLKKLIKSIEYHLNINDDLFIDHFDNEQAHKIIVKDCAYCVILNEIYHQINIITANHYRYGKKYV